MIHQKSKKLLLEQLSKAIQKILIALSNWVLLTSFLEANWWHFLDPVLTGISLSALGLLFATVLITPLLLSIKAIRCYRPSFVILCTLKLIPPALLCLVSSPYLYFHAWKRTVLLAIGVSLIPFSVAWILSKPPISHFANQFTGAKSNAQVYLLDENYGISILLKSHRSMPPENKDLFMDTTFLAAVLLNMSVRYCCGSINAFHENWIFSLFLLVFIGGFEIRNSFLNNFQSLTKSIHHKENNNHELFDENNMNFDQDVKHESDVDRTKMEDFDEFEENHFLLQSNLVNQIVAFGCIQGFGLSILLIIFQMFFNTPRFLMYWSKINYKHDWLIIVFFTFGIVCTFMVPPKGNLFCSSQVVYKLIALIVNQIKVLRAKLIFYI